MVTKSTGSVVKSIAKYIEVRVEEACLTKHKKSIKKD